MGGDLKLYKTGDIGRFLRNGEIECLGRADNQIKIRGLRVELDEIEKCILDTNLIDKVVVKDYKESHSRQYLCAYYVAEFEVDTKIVREQLLKNLPSYMVPQYFIRLPEFIYTPNGKIDKRRLPAPKVEESINLRRVCEAKY